MFDQRNVRHVHLIPILLRVVAVAFISFPTGSLAQTESLEQLFSQGRVRVGRDAYKRPIVLSVANETLDADKWAVIGTCTHLRSLAIVNCKFIGKPEAVLKRLAVLDKLLLQGEGITDDVVAACSDLNTVKECWIVNSSVTDEGVMHLVKLTNVARLNLSGAKITVASCARLAKLENLRSLILNNTDLRGDRMSLTEIRHLARLQQLKHVNLAGSPIDDEDLEHIASLTRLQNLVLSRTRVTGTGLRHLQSCRQLRRLSLRGCPLNTQEFRCLSLLTQLESLDLSETPITNAALTHVSKLKNLTVLKLFKTGATDSVVSQLAEMPKLEWIYVDRITNVTDSSGGMRVPRKKGRQE